MITIQDINDYDFFVKRVKMEMDYLETESKNGQISKELVLMESFVTKMENVVKVEKVIELASFAFDNARLILK